MGMNGQQRTPNSILSLDIQREKQLLTAELDELRTFLEKKGILCKYNDALIEVENKIFSNLERREQLYAERKALDARLYAVSFNNLLTNNKDKTVPSDATGTSSVEAQTRLLNINKNKNKTTSAFPRLCPKPNEFLWNSLTQYHQKSLATNSHENKIATGTLLPKLPSQEQNKDEKLTEQDLLNFRPQNYLFERLDANNNSSSKKFFLLQESHRTTNQCETHTADAVDETGIKIICKTTTKTTEWLPIPEKLRAYPSFREQICKAHKLRPLELHAQVNYFAPLETMDDPELIDLVRNSHAEFDHEMSATSNAQPTQRSTVVTAGVDDLDQILGLEHIPIGEVPLSPASVLPNAKSSPRMITKVKVELVIRNFSKNFDKQERVVKVWSIAKKFDKNAVLCPIVDEPLPVLRSDNEIRTCLLHKYFHDKVPVRKQPPSVLQGFLVFGITIDEREFIAAMKDWANSYGYDFARTDRSATTVVAGFLTNMSLTTSRSEAESSIRRTREFTLLGKPEFYLRISTVYGKSINGGLDRAPAWCIECSREHIDAVVQLCQTVFTGNNKQFPSCIREALYLPTRSLPVGHHARQSYILGQLAYLNSEMTVTCYGLQNINNMVRLQKDSTIQTSLEDILMSIPAVNGKLFRSADMTATEDAKVFLKFDEINASSWLHRKPMLAELLKSIVLPEDYVRVFTNVECELSFSDPWRKVKDGKLSKNVFDIPNASSIAYAAAMMHKLPSGVPENISVKKRGHVAAAAAADNPATVDLTGGESPVSSPSHKVQVVEQRNFSAHTDTGLSQHDIRPSATAETRRVDKLEEVVANHGKQLVDLKASVINLDGKVHQNHEEAKFIFSDFRNVLMDIRSAVGMPAGADKAVPNQSAGGASPESGGTILNECYDPVANKEMWLEKIRDHEQAVRAARADRSQYELVLVREGADASAIDYRQVAYQRYPSPVMERIPDDITLYY